MIGNLPRTIDRSIDLERNVLKKAIVYTALAFSLGNGYLYVLSETTDMGIVGDVSFSITVATIISIIACFGSDSLVLRDLGSKHDLSPYDLTRVLLLSGLSGTVGILIGLVVFFSYDGFYLWAVVWGGLISLVGILSTATQAIVNNSSGLIARKIALPLMVCIAGFATSIFSLEPNFAIGLIVSLGMMVLIIMLILSLLKVSQPTGYSETRTSFLLAAKDAVKIYRNGSGFVAFSLSFALIATSDIILIRLMLSSEEVALYSIAIAAASVGTVGLIFTNTFAPKLMSKFHSRNKIRALNTISRRLAIFNLIIMTAFMALGYAYLCAAYFISDMLIVMIGVYSIYYIGVFFNVACGPAGFALNMTGHQHVSTNIVVQGVMGNIIGNVLLIPWLGVFGAALATAFCTAYINIAMSAEAERLTGIRPGIV